MSAKLHPLDPSLPAFLAPFLPVLLPLRPFVTLTYAQSLDARIAAAPGTRTAISHQETKTMTHFLRANHAAILIGTGTVLADDPGLNCRIEGEESPRPIVIDGTFRWEYKGSKMETLVMAGLAKAPWVLVKEGVDVDLKLKYLERSGGKVIKVKLDQDGRLDWNDILLKLKKEGIDSVMVEGGAHVINELLERHDFVDSLIVTLGPVYLGDKGVAVSPTKSVKLKAVKWWSGIQDSIMAATLDKSEALGRIDV
ncbi:CYFA0S01e16754g1_1 [Cyberlindnera fabianii]|uniref:2,5-diamino-6-ribosylamino-4(3H)-pyrimidinone 5'-phosphate reductase n=1 Tax=Cyberlindnera fabianii TaxID=36022 RepID=A0A061AQW3_CYBFA|nr:CYFA0S01e16754g1_1 [Cyberlindnera fabianii]